MTKKIEQITIDRLLKKNTTHITIASCNGKNGFECMEIDKSFNNKQIIEELEKTYNLNDYIIKERGQDNISKPILKDITITKENIHLYYKFMNDEDLNRYKSLLSDICFERFGEVASCLNMTVDELRANSNQWMITNKVVVQYFFGVKDTLKPINEYIAEIKASDECKRYRADIIYSKLIKRALKMFSKNKENQTAFNRAVNGYADNGKPFFLASFRLSKFYNINDKYQKQWDEVK